MKAYLSSCLVLALALAGCTAQDPTTGTTTVAGQVVEDKSRKPVPGIGNEIISAAPNYLDEQRSRKSPISAELMGLLAEAATSHRLRN